MNDATEREFTAWLSEGPDRGPDGLLEQAFTISRGTRQRPAWLVVLRGKAVTYPRDTFLGRMAVVTSQRVALFVVIGLVVMAALAVLAAGGLTRPHPDPLAFIRNGDLYLAASDGSGERKIASHSSDGSQYADLRWSPDHRYLAAEMDANDGSAELVILSRDGQQVGSFHGGSLMAFSWRPDGERIAVLSNDQPDMIALLGTDGRSAGTLALPAGFRLGAKSWVGGFTWSADGRWIAVTGCLGTCNPKADTNVVLLATDGSGYRQLTDGPRGDAWLAWSPDGRLATYRMCAGSTSTCLPGLSVLTPAGAERDLGRPNGLQVGWLAWSADGSRLATVAGPVGSVVDRLMVISPADGSSALIAGTFAEVFSVDWSADGRTLIFNARAVGDSTGSIWTVDASGGGEPRLLVRDVDTFDSDGRP